MVPVDRKVGLMMNARPNYFCGVLYTLLGAVAAIGTMERFAAHRTGGSLWLVGGSGTLLLTGILIIRETGVQRALQGRLIEPLLQDDLSDANDHAPSKANARVMQRLPLVSCPVELHGSAALTSERFPEVEAEPVLAEFNHPGPHGPQFCVA